MGKATTLPDGVKKAQVVLTTYDEATDTTKVVTREGKNWFSSYGSNWSEKDPAEGHAPKYDPAQEEQNDPETDTGEDETTPDEDDPKEGEGQENENVAEGRLADEDDAPTVDEPEKKPAPPKSEAELKAEAAASKAANQRTAMAQKIAAAEGDPNAGKQNELLNRQARLQGEGVTNQAPVDGGPGGGGAARTLTEREIELLEGSEANKEKRKDARAEKIENAPGIDNTLPEEAAEELAALKEENSKLRLELRRKNAMIDKQQVALRGKFEGRVADADDEEGAGSVGPGKNSPAHLAPQPMAGVYPHNTDQIPTVDEINARNGQPERSPRPAVRGSKQRDEQGYPIVPPEQKTEL